MKFTEMRKKIGTQTEVAKLLNVNQQNVAAWENGKAYPRRQMLKQIAKLFNVSEGDVLQLIDNSKIQGEE